MTKARLRACRHANKLGLDTSAFTPELLDEIEQLREERNCFEEDFKAEKAEANRLRAELEERNE